MTLSTRSLRFCSSLALAGVFALLTGSVLAARQDVQMKASQLLMTRTCTKCDLSNATFTGKNLKGVDLAEANLTGATFYKADLTNANLAGADLTKANLTLADLSNANFSGANLTGANLMGAKAAALAGATTTNTTICPDGQAGPCR